MSTPASAITKAVLRRHMLGRMRAMSPASRQLESDAVAAVFEEFAQRRGWLAARDANEKNGDATVSPFILLAFLSQPMEIDTAPLIRRVLASGNGRVLVPHVVADKSATRGGEMVFVEIFGGNDVAMNFPESGSMKLREATPAVLAEAMPFAVETAAAVAVGDHSGGFAMASQGVPSKSAHQRALMSAEDAGRLAHAMLAPGVAFDAADGSRCGRGGGFYDEFIRQMRTSAATAARAQAGDAPAVIGVGYAGQVRPADGPAATADAATTPEVAHATNPLRAGEWFTELDPAAAARPSASGGIIPVMDHDERVNYVLWCGGLDTVRQRPPKT